MTPIDFPGTNITLVKPDDMADEECISTRAMGGLDKHGRPYILTAWQPSYEDIQAINAGRPIMLSVTGESFPPLSIYTFDENFDANR